MLTDKWVRWEDLVNKSKHQTLSELKEFLFEKGLMVFWDFGEVHASRMAWRLGFAKEIDGKERWHLRRYISMMQSDAKIKKLLKQGRPVARAEYRRALIDPPESYSEKEDFRARFEHATRD
jgi:hypothetical protein